MSESIKLTQEELTELKNIQVLYQEKTYSFGQLYIDRLNLTERQKEVDKNEEKIKQELIDTQKKEQEWISKISSKYGEGNLSLASGTFTPNTKNS